MILNLATFVTLAATITVPFTDIADKYGIMAGLVATLLFLLVLSVKRDWRTARDMTARIRQLEERQYKEMQGYLMDTQGCLNKIAESHSQLCETIRGCKNRPDSGRFKKVEGE